MPISNYTGRSLWARDNLFAWSVGPFDAKRRGPEERARMLKKLGFRSFAHRKGRDTVEADIESLKRHGVNLLAWYLNVEADDPGAEATFEAFRRYDIRPQIWVTHSFSDLVRTPEEWAKLLPNGPTLQRIKEEPHTVSETDLAEIQAVVAQLHTKNYPKTPEEQEKRVKREADRIHAFVKLAAPYGCRVNLYNHNGWFGMVEN